MTPILAHGGHWAVSLIYLAPLVLLVGSLAVVARRGRRGADDLPGTEEPSYEDDLGDHW